MFATAHETREELTSRWLQVLPRMALVTVLVALLLIVTELGGVGMRASDNAQGPEYAEMLAAARSPGFYRLAMVWDALAWLMIGATLLTLAGAFGPRAPVRSAFIAACAVGQLSGVLGGFLRLDGISDVAARYAAAGGQSAALLDSAGDLVRVIGALFHAGNLLQGLGFVLVAWTALSLGTMPRWLAAWFFVPGVLPLLQFVIVASGLPFSFPLLMAHIVLGLMGSLTATAILYWRPTARRLAAAAA